jgi:hypothetical protein
MKTRLGGVIFTPCASFSPRPRYQHAEEGLAGFFELLHSPTSRPRLGEPLLGVFQGLHPSFDHALDAEGRQPQLNDRSRELPHARGCRRQESRERLRQEEGQHNADDLRQVLSDRVRHLSRHTPEVLG